MVASVLILEAGAQASKQVGSEAPFVSVSGGGDDVLLTCSPGLVRFAVLFLLAARYEIFYDITLRILQLGLYVAGIACGAMVCGSVIVRGSRHVSEGFL